MENAWDVLKVGFSISRAQGATAISDAWGNHSYVELLRFSFQLSLLLQSLLPGERQLPVANTCIEAHAEGVNEIQHDGSKTLGVFVVLNWSNFKRLVSLAVMLGFRYNHGENQGITNVQYL